jgi:hypothetical protein
MKRANALLFARPRDLRDALISVGHRPRARKIERLQFSDLKSGPNDELVYLAIQMTTARDPLPIRGKPVLPRNHPGIGSTPVFEEYEAPAGLNNATHLLKSFRTSLLKSCNFVAGSG